MENERSINGKRIYTVTKIWPKTIMLRKKKRVAAYARVSVETERLHHSLSAQISYYSSLIQAEPTWEYAGVYADDGVTGTLASRRCEFMRMLADCEAGKIDLILTKSISRFARNTVDLLRTARRLKEIGVEIRFEKEGISTFEGTGEVMLTLLASFAQEESRSISENVKWGIRKRYAEGIPYRKFQVYGYEWVGDELKARANEAGVVRLIFSLYMQGHSIKSIKNMLDGKGIRTSKGGFFCEEEIRMILRNEKYSGRIILQKMFCADPISKKVRKNAGELPMYVLDGTHEPIIPPEEFKDVQDEIRRRAAMPAIANLHVPVYPFSGKIKCGGCGGTYRRYAMRWRKDRDDICATWKCAAKGCHSKGVREECLAGLEGAERIIINGNMITAFFGDGRTASKKIFTPQHIPVNHSCLSGIFRCSECGSIFKRQVRKRKQAFFYGKIIHPCERHFIIEEDEAYRIFAAANGNVDHIDITPDKKAVYHYKEELC